MIFLKGEKNYLNIVQGAVCSSPDSGELWTLTYLDEKPFVFKGELILCTIKTKDEINAKKKVILFCQRLSFYLNRPYGKNNSL